MENILEKIHKAGLSFLEPLTPEETYETILREAIELVGADNGAIHLYSDGEFKVVYATNPNFYQIKPRKKGHIARVFKTQKPEISDISAARKAHPEIRRLGLKSGIFIPLSYHKKSLGVLALNSRKREKFSSKEINVLKLFGSVATLAIRKAQLYGETKKALETRDLFISMAAHELRTPLTSVNGYIQLLHSKLSATKTPESRWVEQLYWESIRLTKLVNELLEINQIKSGRLDYFLKECSMRGIMHRIANEFHFAYPDRELVFNDQLKEKLDLVIGDYDKILQVISNLVSNAVKFSPVDSPITINLKSRPPDLLLEVKDQGIGIPKGEMDKIFDGYYKAERNSKEGMGLGLFIAKKIVRELRGSIQIKSVVNKGTTAKVKFPLIQV